jgi:hypothetical protein
MHFGLGVVPARPQCFKVCDPFLFLLDQLLKHRGSWIAS